jgi:hypothetical protein
MEEHKLIVVGDIHLQDKEPKKSNGIDTLNWIFDNKDLNNEKNDLVMLGDIAEINSPFKIYSVYVDLFTNKSRFNKIRIIQGNHDLMNIDSILDLFSPLKNVEVITDWKIIDFYNTKILALPYYNHESTERKSMKEVYSHLYENEEIKDVEFDYCMGHIEDETNHFSSKNFCDLSQLKVKHFLHGHIHTCNLDKGGRYLGSACMNSSTEHGNTKYLAIIDGETKEFELKEIPKFMEYYTVEYPNKLEKPKTRYAIFTVKGVLDKNVALEEYSKQAKELGFEFYTNKVLKQRVTEVEIDDDLEKSEKPTFEKFVKTVGLSNEIFDICTEIIRLKEDL